VFHTISFANIKGLVDLMASSRSLHYAVCSDLLVNLL